MPKVGKKPRDLKRAKVYGGRSGFIVVERQVLLPKDARKLAAWLTRTADWVTSKT